MSKILEKHDCGKIPDNYAVLNSAANGWLIASLDGSVAETRVIGIKVCPFCGERLDANDC